MLVRPFRHRLFSYNTGPRLKKLIMHKYVVSCQLHPARCQLGVTLDTSKALNWGMMTETLIRPHNDNDHNILLMSVIWWWRAWATLRGSDLEPRAPAVARLPASARAKGGCGGRGRLCLVECRYSGQVEAADGSMLGLTFSDESDYVRPRRLMWPLALFEPPHHSQQLVEWKKCKPCFRD